MRLTPIVVCALAGCFPERSAELVCQVDNDCDSGRVCEDGFCVKDRTVDAGVDDDAAPPPVSCADFNGQGFAGCSIPGPNGPLALDTAGTYTYDTNTGVLSGPSGSINVAKQSLPSGAMLISVEKLVVASGATLRVTGLRPLVVASWSTISVAGTIDVGSTPQSPGAGANPGACTNHAPFDGIDDVAGSDGGGGGGYGGPGGRGGAGNGAPQGAPGGSAVGVGALLGGCTGGRGGNGNAPGGPGGNGGGAIQLSALAGVDIAGRVLAGGGGGGGATGDNGGGGGGGSGGMILLEGATVTTSGGAILAANGGGGGGGSGGGQAQAGANGQASAAPAQPGPGQSGGSSGGAGAAGAALSGTQGVDDNDRGGGGGGGGAGFIVIFADTLATPTGTISPAATLLAR